MKTKLLLLICLGCFIKNNFSQTLLVLQPDSVAGKDALIGGCIPCGYDNSNFGKHPDFLASAWTNGGNYSPTRALIEFDLSTIPAGSIILNAEIFLYHYNSPYNVGHSTLSGPNTALLQRITQPWGETTLTWNNQPTTTTLNQVTLAASTSTNQNYLNINVSSLVKDMVNNPAQSFGFMFRLQNETIYRSMLFASSDVPDQSVWPKLEISYVFPVGIQESNAQNYWTMFPNPNKGNFTINYPGQINSIDIYNVLGEKVHANGASKEINASDLTTGIYFVKVQDNNKTVSKKFIVE